MSRQRDRTSMRILDCGTLDVALGGRLDLPNASVLE